MGNVISVVPFIAGPLLTGIGIGLSMRDEVKEWWVFASNMVAQAADGRAPSATPAAAATAAAHPLPPSLPPPPPRRYPTIKKPSW